jgi:hypothetical protein
MHVITRQRLQEFWQTHPDAERPLKAWLLSDCESTWESQRISSSVLAKPLTRASSRRAEARGSCPALDARYLEENNL